jgi:hypothetical protein
MVTAIPHLALLVCDVPVPEVVKDYGEYPIIFDRLFRTSLPDGVSDFTFHSYDVRNAKEYPPKDVLDTCDGIVITGSCNVLRCTSRGGNLTFYPHLAASAYEDVEWINILVSWVANIATNRPHIKIIGAPKGIKFT